MKRLVKRDERFRTKGARKTGSRASSMHNPLFSSSGGFTSGYHLDVLSAQSRTFQTSSLGASRQLAASIYGASSIRQMI